MKDSEAKFKFIQRRAQGESYDSIARELNKSKSTLIKWSIELQSEIKNMEFEQYQSLVEQFKFTQRAKIEFLAEIVNKAREALKSKDLAQIPLKDLILVIEKYENSLNNELSQIIYRTGEYECVYDGIENELNGRYEVTKKLV